MYVLSILIPLCLMPDHFTCNKLSVVETWVHYDLGRYWLIWRCWLKIQHASNSNTKYFPNLPLIFVFKNLDRDCFAVKEMKRVLCSYNLQFHLVKSRGKVIVKYQRCIELDVVSVGWWYYWVGAVYAAGRLRPRDTMTEGRSDCVKAGRGDQEGEPCPMSSEWEK